MKPLIKWPGGKTGEIKQFETLIPEYERYIEPFVGGGALYFFLNPEKAVINDNSPDLMDFYGLLRDRDEQLHRILDLYCRTFSALMENCEKNYPRILALYRLYEYAQEQEMDIGGLQIHRQLTEEIATSVEELGSLVPDEEEYLETMRRSVEEKCIRTVANHHRKPLSDKDLKDNLITGFTGGFYLYFRNVFNQIASGRLICSAQYRIANFYFIREYCYGSMFRYNKDGEFNIPYGGISYNRKDMAGKIRRMFAPETAALLGRTQLYCEDFETLIRKLELTEKDFIFLDPPYDTEFSEYEGRDFTRDDQKRLADLLADIPAKFLLVIKNTDYIYSLYEGKFRILSFENRYVYNVRSRNERKAEHLIITNIPEGEIPWIRETVSEEN